MKGSAKDRKTRNCPHLAFFEPEYYDRVVAAADTRNGKYRRKLRDGEDPRRNTPKKRTRVPGQMAYCGICGRLYVFGGHGQTDHLMCNGARAHRCWNGVTIDGPLAAERIAMAIARAIEELEDFDPAYEQLLNAEAARLNDSLDGKIQQIDDDLGRKQKEAEHVLSEIRSGNKSQMLRDDLTRLEDEIAQLELDRQDAECTRVGKVVLPSAAELKELYVSAFKDLATDSYKFARKLRLIVPRIVVSPYQLCDGGDPVLRAKFRLLLANLLPDSAARKACSGLMEKVMEVDVFDPPQREKFRTQVVELRKAGHKEPEVAKMLGITKTAAQDAAALQRLMDKLGISNAYLPITSAPDDTRLRRHRHKRYKFEPLDGAGEV